MDHPIIKEMETWGYPKRTGYEYVAVDSMNNEIYPGDEYFEFDDELFLIEALTADAIEVLEIIGAERKIAHE